MEKQKIENFEKLGAAHVARGGEAPSEIRDPTEIYQKLVEECLLVGDTDSADPIVPVDYGPTEADLRKQYPEIPKDVIIQ